MSDTDQRVIEAVRLLRSDLIWSADFEQIREPLADLLDLVMQLPTHQLDDALDALTSKVISLEPVNVYTNELEQWIRTVERSMQKVDQQNSKENIFQKIFRRS
jgi:hypothetical protein